MCAYFVLDVDHVVDERRTSVNRQTFTGASCDRFEILPPLRS